MVNRSRALILSLAAALLLSATHADSGETVRVNGSTTFLPFVRQVGEHYMATHPGSAIVISGGGSARGYKALLDGTADVAMASGPMPDELEREFARRNIRLVTKTIGYRPLVAAVHPDNPISDVTRAELGALFSGRLSNWSMLGGKASVPVRVIVGPPHGGLTELWKDQVLAEGETFATHAEVMTARQRTAEIARSPGAITYLAKDEIRGRLKYLSIGGVAATPANVISGAYPLTSPFMLITKEAPLAAARIFIDHFFIPDSAWDLNGLIIASPR